MEEVQTLEINGNDYILVDSITDRDITYHFYSNENNVQDIYILKDKEGEENLISTETPNEFNKALILYYEKHKNDIFEGATTW